MLRPCVLLLAFLPLLLPAQTIPITGTAQPALSNFDTTMTQIMSTYGVPGAALAVAHNGQLVFARGYGYADTTTGAQVQPDSLFRIASDTKPHTAAAIYKLIERHQLSLDDKAFTILSNLTPLPGYSEDPRIAQITVQDLLDHMSGWYGEADGTGYDPLFDVDNIAAVAGTTPPADPTTIIRYVLGRPLDTDPGSYYSYSNFGYLVLGQIIAQVSGQSYESFVLANVTGPLGNSRTQFGATLTALPGEVTYYPYPGEPLTTSVFPGGGQVPFPYGGYDLEANHANGGLVSSTIDLLRFLTSINGSRGPQLFQTPVSSSASSYLPPFGPGYMWTFHGSLPGNNSGLILLPDQTAICYLTNTRQQSYNAFFDAIDAALQSDATAVTAWPGADLFPQFQTGFLVVHAADYQPVATAPDQFVTLLGTNLSTGTGFADTIPLPTTLGGASATLINASGTTAPVPLDYVSPGQINLVIPSGFPTGAATLSLNTGAGTLSTTIQIDSVSPGIFTANASGVGVPTALAGLYHADGTVSAESVFSCPAAYQCVPAPMSVGASTDILVVSLYGTGVRHNSGLANVTATLNGQSVPVLYAGAQGQYAGLDQVNVQIPPSFKAAGNVPLILTVDGRVSNTVTIGIQ